jgi:hypothetical protein
MLIYEDLVDGEDVRPQQAAELGDFPEIGDEPRPSPKDGDKPANSDHVYKGGDQDDADRQHQDFVKFEAGDETHFPHGYPQSSTRHRGYCAAGTEAKM